MRISDWSSDVCSSDLHFEHAPGQAQDLRLVQALVEEFLHELGDGGELQRRNMDPRVGRLHRQRERPPRWRRHRSEEHTSELQSLMRISYAVFCLKKKKKSTTFTLIHNLSHTPTHHHTTHTT